MGAGKPQGPIFGPWSATKQDAHWSVHASDHDAPPMGNLVCKLPLGEQGAARARLIAAAPDMFAALKAALAKLEAVGWLSDLPIEVAGIRTAIAKAEKRP